MAKNLVEVSGIIKNEHESLLAGLRFDGEHCPFCHENANIESWAMTIPPIFVQMYDETHGNTRNYESERFCCLDCRELWDVVKVNKVVRPLTALD